MPTLNNLNVVFVRDKDGNFTPINGLMGSPGRGIVSIERTSGDGTSGSIDVYTITYTDKTTSTFEVYNGSDGESGATPEQIAAAIEQYLSENPFVKKETDPTVFRWAKAELFDKNALVDPAGRNSFVTIDDIEYYRYNASAQNFEWNNPNPQTGSVAITARGVSQYGGTGSTRLRIFFDDGTEGEPLFIIVNGESRTVTYTTPSDKVLAKITGNYDMENWVLLDMSVMSCMADYPAPKGTVKTVNGISPDGNGNIQFDAADVNAVPQNQGVENAGKFLSINESGEVIPVESGADGITPHIGANGNWYIGETDTGIKAQGEKGADGTTPHIGENGDWYIGETDTGIKAQGEKGEKGDPGEKGTTPHIGENGNWWIGDTDTGVKAVASGGSGTDIALGITGASAGQIAKIKAVDASGAPTEWEAADIPIVDDTLTIPGEAADAAVVGQKLTEQSDKIAAIPSGKDGVGIQSVVQTTTSAEDGGTNVVTVTKTDGSSSTFTVKNGSKGSDGAPGTDGAPGVDGHTPVKGTDYFTDAEKQEIAEDAAALVDLSGKQNKITASGILKGDAAGGVTAAEAGVDYAAPSLGLTGAAVGQAPMVKTVDEQGNPTEWGPATLVKADGSNIPNSPGVMDAWRTRIAALPGTKVYGKADANGKIKAYVDAACTEEASVNTTMELIEHGNALLIYDRKTYQCVGFEKPASVPGFYIVPVFSRSEIATDSASAVLKVETAKLNIADYLSGDINAPITITAGELPLTTTTTT